MPKARTEPWVNTDTKNKSSVGAALLVPANVIPQTNLTYGSAAPLGLNKCISMINPGLAPWAMKECRPCRAPCGRTLSSICRKSSDLLGGIVVCACCRICWVISLLALAVGLVGCRCLRLLLGLLGGAGVSAVGTILLQSPGWNEGKARNATLGKHRQKRIELRRSDTFGVSSCWGQGNIALAGLIYVFITNQLLWDCCSDCLRSCRKSLWLATTFLLCVRANL